MPEGTKVEAGGEGGQSGLQGPDQQPMSDPNMGAACPEHKLPKTESRAVVDIVASAGLLPPRELEDTTPQLPDRSGMFPDVIDQLDFAACTDADSPHNLVRAS